MSLARVTSILLKKATHWYCQPLLLVSFYAIACLAHVADRDSITPETGLPPWRPPRCKRCRMTQDPHFSGTHSITHRLLSRIRHFALWHWCRLGGEGGGEGREHPPKLCVAK